MRLLSLTIILSTIYTITFSQSLNKETENGYNIFYYPNKQISSEGNMVNGKPDGLWKSYYVDGTLKSIGLRKNALLDSVWVFYNKDGNIFQKINYQFGKKNGYLYTFKYFKNKNDSLVGYLASQELYLNNQKNGISEYYYKNSVIKEAVNYSKGKKHGITRIYSEQGVLNVIVEYRYGKEIDREIINQYKDSVKIGVWKEFYPNGNIKSEKTYRLGVLNGLVKEYDITGNLITANRFENGELKDTSITLQKNIKIVEEFYNKKNEQGELIKKASGGFIDSIPIGVHRTYDSLGRVNSSRTYDKFGNIISKGIVSEEGDKLGYWEYYYSSGTIKSKGNYKKHRRVGVWKYYYKNGQLEQIGKFNKGLPDGLWKYYFENGQIKREEYYKYGKEDGEIIEYDLQNNIIVRGNYYEGLKDGKWFYDFYFHTEEGNYKNDLKEGSWIYYYKNKNIYFTGNFIQNNPDGKHIYYYKNGKIKTVKYYSFGRKVKNWEFYDYYGTLLKILTFENDKLTKIDGISVKID
jgi:antitoxin component YwqK of YwqJK toxin-antitoxin module